MYSGWRRAGDMNYSQITSSRPPYFQCPANEMLTQGWFNVGPPSATADQHWANLEWASRSVISPSGTHVQITGGISADLNLIVTRWRPLPGTPVLRSGLICISRALGHTPHTDACYQRPLFIFPPMQTNPYQRHFLIPWIWKRRATKSGLERDSAVCHGVSSEGDTRHQERPGENWLHVEPASATLAQRRTSLGSASLPARSISRWRSLYNPTMVVFSLHNLLTISFSLNVYVFQSLIFCYL